VTDKIVFTADEIKQLLSELSDVLGTMGVKGEICLYGGAVMCIVFDARPNTKDVDAIFKPTEQIREAAKRVAEVHNLKGDWLNDAVKGFIVQHPQEPLLNFPSLEVFIPRPDYLLAMKAIAARVETSDPDDVRLLIKLLNLKSANEVFAILEHYYPRQQIKPATQYFIEELFEQ
jgi:hypothetical protein